MVTRLAKWPQLTAGLAKHSGQRCWVSYSHWLNRSSGRDSGSLGWNSKITQKSSARMCRLMSIRWYPEDISPQRGYMTAIACRRVLLANRLSGRVPARYTESITKQ
uniref:(northern house mosquito) hypothetical protein n=1 Tax=Culex pipiens TaxID=7175 RepID=A0A8D8FYX3_CULPI